MMKTSTETSVFSAAVVLRRYGFCVGPLPRHKDTRIPRHTSSFLVTMSSWRSPGGWSGWVYPITDLRTLHLAPGWVSPGPPPWTPGDPPSGEAPGGIPRKVIKVRKGFYNRVLGAPRVTRIGYPQTLEFPRGTPKNPKKPHFWGVSKNVKNYENRAIIFRRFTHLLDLQGVPGGGVGGYPRGSGGSPGGIPGSGGYPRGAYPRIQGGPYGRGGTHPGVIISGVPSSLVGPWSWTPGKDRETPRLTKKSSAHERSPVRWRTPWPKGLNHRQDRRRGYRGDPLETNPREVYRSGDTGSGNRRSSEAWVG